jgi:hypothetical protein
MIPSFIDSFDCEMRKYLSDSRTIVQIMHRYGLSSKYLGLIYKKASEKQSFHVKHMVERVILVKTFKYIIKHKFREAPFHLHRTILKNIFICIF